MEKVNVNGQEFQIHNYKCIFVPVMQETITAMSGGQNDETFTVYGGDEDYLELLVEDGQIHEDDIEDVKRVIQLLKNETVNMVTFNYCL